MLIYLGCSSIITSSTWLALSQFPTALLHLLHIRVKWPSPPLLGLFWVWYVFHGSPCGYLLPVVLHYPLPWIITHEDLLHFVHLFYTFKPQGEQMQKTSPWHLLSMISDTKLCRRCSYFKKLKVLGNVGSSYINVKHYLTASNWQQDTIHHKSSLYWVANAMIFGVITKTINYHWKAYENETVSDKFYFKHREFLIKTLKN